MLVVSTLTFLTHNRFQVPDLAGRNMYCVNHLQPQYHTKYNDLSGHGTALLVNSNLLNSNAFDSHPDHCQN